MISRRRVLTKIGAAAGAAAFSPRQVFTQAPAAQQSPARREPPSVISNPPRDFPSR